MSVLGELPDRPVMLPADLMSMAYIAHRLREADRVECFAGRLTTPDALAMDVMAVPGFIDVCWLSGAPVAAIGARQLWSGVWSVWAFGTDDWHRVTHTLTKHVIRFLFPAVLNLDGHRAECASHVGHHEAHAWLEWLGFEREALMRGHGRNGEDFYLYSCLRGSHDVPKQWGRRRNEHRSDRLSETTGRASSDR
jgi:hypothetical protein